MPCEEAGIRMLYELFRLIRKNRLLEESMPSDLSPPPISACQTPTHEKKALIGLASWAIAVNFAQDIECRLSARSCNT